jgi:hypothetical protein
MTNLKFDPTDLRLLSAFDSSVIIDDDNESAVITDCKVTIVRSEDDIMELLVEFPNLELPIRLSRTRLLKTLNIAGES